jgi:hypothetical protein
MRRKVHQHSDDAFAGRVDEFVLIDDLNGWTRAAGAGQRGRVSGAWFDPRISSGSLTFCHRRVRRRTWRQKGIGSLGVDSSLAADVLSGRTGAFPQLLLEWCVHWGCAKSIIYTPCRKFLKRTTPKPMA